MALAVIAIVCVAAPLLAAGALTLGKWGPRLVVAAAAVASLTTLAGGILGASRVAQIMGKERELPEKIGEAKGKTPKAAVPWLGLGTAAVTLLFNLRPLLNIANVLTLPRWISWFGLIGCVVLLFVLPWRAILLAALTLVVLVGYRYFRNRGVNLDVSADLSS